MMVLPHFCPVSVLVQDRHAAVRRPSSGGWVRHDKVRIADLWRHLPHRLPPYCCSTHHSLFGRGTLPVSS